MGYQALYRKFRPDNFDDVKGQDAIVTTLRNQITADRIGHAYLFCGTRGTGKTSVAKIMGRAVNCENPVNGNPCNQCRVCKAILSGASLNVIEIDAASNNGVDNIREIREEVTYRPTEGKYKVYIIDEVHMLSPGAFNALLKTLEEPPSYVIFILATTEAHKIPVTILSRCQRYDFRRITIDTISERLSDLLRREGVEAEEKAVRCIARAGDESMRDALSLLDQCISFYLGQKLTYDNVLEVLGAVDTEVFSRLFREIIKRDAGAVIRILDEMITAGRDLTQLVTDFTWYLRNLLIVKTTDDPEGAVDVSSDNYRLLEEESRMADENTLMRFIRVFSELSGQLKFAVQKRVLTEVALIKLCRPAMETNMDSLLDRIRMLEQKMEEGTVRVSQSAADENTPGEHKEELKSQKPEPVYATPEDLKRIVADWSFIAGRTQGILHEILKDGVPSYDGSTGENILYIVFPGDNLIAKSHLDRPEYLEELGSIIEKRTGKTVEIRMVTDSDRKNNVLSGISAEDVIREKVHFEVETED